MKNKDYVREILRNVLKRKLTKNELNSREFKNLVKSVDDDESEQDQQIKMLEFFKKAGMPFELRELIRKEFSNQDVTGDDYFHAARSLDLTFHKGLNAFENTNNTKILDEVNNIPLEYLNNTLESLTDLEKDQSWQILKKKPPMFIKSYMKKFNYMKKCIEDRINKENK